MPWSDRVSYPDGLLTPAVTPHVSRELGREGQVMPVVSSQDRQMAVHLHQRRDTEEIQMDDDFQLNCGYCDTAVWASEAEEISRTEWEWICPNARCIERNYYNMAEDAE